MPIKSKKNNVKVIDLSSCDTVDTSVPLDSTNPVQNGPPVSNTPPQASTTAADITENIILPESGEEDKKKRRGRKPKDKFAFDDVCMDKPEGLTEPDNNLVIKIPISCMELGKEFNLADTYSITCPKPFEKIVTDSTYKYLYDSEQPDNGHCGGNYEGMFQNGILQTAGDTIFNMECITPGNNTRPAVHELLNDIVETNNKKQLTQVEILLEKKYKHTKQIGLLTNICIGQDDSKWIDKTNLACFWDCHCFDHQPWGVPTKFNYLTGKFTLFGVFCSPNCAMSYLLTYETNTNTLWERVSLLNLLYYKIYETDENIIPAPDKICLKLFGGPLDIHEFRALTIKNNKIYNINFPPCNVITPVLEETKKVFNQDSYFIPNDKKKQNKIQTELKIKRTRSVTSNKNTLDSLISVK